MQTLITKNKKIENMGKFNEIQEQTTQSWGANSFTTTIKDNTVEFDSAKDKFTFKDPVEVPSINVGGTESVPFSAEDKTKLDNLQTPMQIKGRVDSVSDLPTEDVQVGDVYLVGLSGSETFDEYVCTGFAGSPEAPVWESVGSTQVQADWNQNDSTKADYIKNRICYDSTTQLWQDQTFAFSEQGYFDNAIIIYSDTQLIQRDELTSMQSVNNDDIYFTLQGRTFYADDNFSDAFSIVSRTESTIGSMTIYGTYLVDTQQWQYVINGGGNPTYVANLVFEIFKSTLVKIDDKFIPDNVVRVADLPKMTVDVISTSPSSSTLLAKEGTYTCAYTDGNKTAITFQIDDTSDTTKVHEFEGIVSFGASLTPSLGNLYPVDAAGERILNTTLFTSNNVSASGNYTFKAKWYYRSGSNADLIVEFNRAYNA